MLWGSLALISSTAALFQLLPGPSCQAGCRGSCSGSCILGLKSYLETSKRLEIK